MAGTTRKILKINGDAFRIVCKECDELAVLFFDGTSLSEITPEFFNANDSFSTAIIDAKNDGYYIVAGSNRNKVLSKGSMPYRMFFFTKYDGDELHIGIFEKDGVEIKTILADYIGFGIYTYVPTRLDETVVLVNGKFFRSYPNEELSKNSVQKCTNGLKYDIEKQDISISTHSSKTSATISNQKVSASIGGTVFRIE